MKKIKLFEQYISEKREDVGKHDEVHKVVTEGKRRLSFKEADITNTLDLSKAMDALRVADISWDQKGQSFTFNSTEDLKTAREVLQLDESVISEGMSKDRMIKQIKRALKDGTSIFKLPMDTQKYYYKNKSDFESDKTH